MTAFRQWARAVGLSSVFFVAVFSAVAMANATNTSKVRARPLASEVFSVLGDAGRWNRSTQSLRDSMLRVGVLKMIMPGDNLYSGTYETAWNPWIDEGFEFPVVAIGNHNSGYAKEIEFFNMPGELYSYVVANRARFVVLNSDNRHTVAQQMRFLEDEMNASREPMNFLVYHHPTYTMTNDHTWGERREFQLAIRPLLKKHRAKLTAIILGHDHIATLGHWDDLPYVISGAGQNMRRGYSRDDMQDGTYVKTDWVVGGFPVWMKLEINATGAVMQAIRASDDKVLCTAELATGVRARPGADCFQ